MALTTRLPSSKCEPFYGFVETTGDALRLIQAARQGIIPRITRRLNDLERRAMIRSGAIFIFSDEESGIKRWTEGLSWSASRIVGNFLVYREVNDRGLGRSSQEGRKPPKRRANPAELSAEQLAEQKLSKTLVGCLSDNHGRFKSNGLIKKTITVCVEGSDHHLIAYYSQEDVRLGKLLPLSSRTDIMLLNIPSELLETTKFRVPPITDTGMDGRLRYICDADDTESMRLPFPVSPISPISPVSPSQFHSLPGLPSHGFFPRHLPDSPTGYQSNNAICDPTGFSTSFMHSEDHFFPGVSSVDHAIQPFEAGNLGWDSRPSSSTSAPDFSRPPSSSTISDFARTSSSNAKSAPTTTTLMHIGGLDAYCGGGGGDGIGPAPHQAQNEVQYFDASGVMLEHLLPPGWNGLGDATNGTNGSLGPTFSLSSSSPASDDLSPTSNVFAWPPTDNQDSAAKPSSYSSLPSTPTRPRQNSQRFTSLPSASLLDLPGNLPSNDGFAYQLNWA